MKPVFLALLPLLVPHALEAQRHHAAARNAVVAAEGVRLVRISSAAGVLKIDGRKGQTNVVVNGVARGSNRGMVEDVRLVTRREGDVLVIHPRMPERGYRFWRVWNPSLDMSIEVPAGMALEIADESGDVVIQGVGPVRITDGSGDISMKGITGMVRVRDGAGNVDIGGVDGDVEVRDGAGRIRVNTITGTFRVGSDGSGSILARAVAGAVIIGRDGGGHVEVDRIGGDFAVEKKDGGRVKFNDVKGSVRIPERFRARKI